MQDMWARKRNPAQGPRAAPTQAPRIIPVSAAAREPAPVQDQKPAFPLERAEVEAEEAEAEAEIQPTRPATLVEKKMKRAPCEAPDPVSSAATASHSGAKRKRTKPAVEPGSQAKATGDQKPKENQSRIGTQYATIGKWVKAVWEAMDDPKSTTWARRSCSRRSPTASKAKRIRARRRPRPAEDYHEKSGVAGSSIAAPAETNNVNSEELNKL
eukprot:2571895-Pleurochrysis_carterae.AAC.1